MAARAPPSHGEKPREGSLALWRRPLVVLDRLEQLIVAQQLLAGCLGESEARSDSLVQQLSLAELDAAKDCEVTLY